MQLFKKFLDNNKAWAKKIEHEKPGYFKQMAKQQKPAILCIGCLDSRVSAERVVNAQPGEIFIHRNLANQVSATDINCSSVLQYGVNVLRNKHIIVRCHYHCGEIKAALGKQHPELLITHKWLMHVKNVYRLHQTKIDCLLTEEQRINTTARPSTAGFISCLMAY